jgi:integrase
MPRVSTVRIGPGTINSAKPKTNRYEIRDSALPGFMLRVAPNGKKLFYVQLERGMKRQIGDAAVFTLTQARNIALDMLQRHSKGERIESRLDRNPTLEEFAKSEYRDWANHNLKNGEDNVKRILRTCKPLLSTKLIKLSEIQIERWKMQRLKSGLSPITVRRDLAELKAALSKAVKWRLISVNPTQHVKVKAERHHRVRYLTEAERSSLLKALKDRDEKKRAGRKSGNVFRIERGYETKPEISDFSDYLTPLVLLVMNSGLRRSEALSLSWENTQLNHNPHITVHAAHAKSGKTRHVPLNAAAVDVLKRWANEEEPTGLVFPSATGDTLKSIKTAWGKLMKDSGIKDFRFHDLRHDFASRLVMNSVDLYTVKELLGHGTIEMTQRYAHLSPAKLNAAVATLEQLN